MRSYKMKKRYIISMDKINAIPNSLEACSVSPGELQRIEKRGEERKSRNFIPTLLKWNSPPKPNGINSKAEVDEAARGSAGNIKMTREEEENKKNPPCRRVSTTYEEDDPDIIKPASSYDSQKSLPPLKKRHDRHKETKFQTDGFSYLELDKEEDIVSAVSQKTPVGTAKIPPTALVDDDQDQDINDEKEDSSINTMQQVPPPLDPQKKKKEEEEEGETSMHSTGRGDASSDGKDKASPANLSYQKELEQANEIKLKAMERAMATKKSRGYQTEGETYTHESSSVLVEGSNKPVSSLPLPPPLQALRDKQTCWVLQEKSESKQSMRVFDEGCQTLKRPYTKTVAPQVHGSTLGALRQLAATSTLKSAPKPPCDLRNLINPATKEAKTNQILATSGKEEDGDEEGLLSKKLPEEDAQDPMAAVTAQTIPPATRTKSTPNQAPTAFPVPNSKVAALQIQQEVEEKGLSSGQDPIAAAGMQTLPRAAPTKYTPNQTPVAKAAKAEAIPSTQHRVAALQMQPNPPKETKTGSDVTESPSKSSAKSFGQTSSQRCLPGSTLQALFNLSQSKNKPFSNPVFGKRVQQEKGAGKMCASQKAIGGSDENSPLMTSASKSKQMKLLPRSRPPMNSSENVECCPRRSENTDTLSGCSNSFEDRKEEILFDAKAAIPAEAYRNSDDSLEAGSKGLPATTTTIEVDLDASDPTTSHPPPIRMRAEALPFNTRIDFVEVSRVATTTTQLEDFHNWKDSSSAYKKATIQKEIEDFEIAANVSLIALAEPPKTKVEGVEEMEAGIVTLPKPNTVWHKSFLMSPDSFRLELLAPFQKRRLRTFGARIVDDAKESTTEYCIELLGPAPLVREFSSLCRTWYSKKLAEARYYEVLKDPWSYCMDVSIASWEGTIGTAFEITSHGACVGVWVDLADSASKWENLLGPSIKLAPPCGIAICDVCEHDLHRDQVLSIHVSRHFMDLDRIDKSSLFGNVYLNDGSLALSLDQEVTQPTPHSEGGQDDTSFVLKPYRSQWNECNEFEMESPTYAPRYDSNSHSCSSQGANVSQSPRPELENFETFRSMELENTNSSWRAEEDSSSSNFFLESNDNNSRSIDAASIRSNDPANESSSLYSKCEKKRKRKRLFKFKPQAATETAANRKPKSAKMKATSASSDESTSASVSYHNIRDSKGRFKSSATTTTSTTRPLVNKRGSFSKAIDGDNSDLSLSDGEIEDTNASTGLLSGQRNKTEASWQETFEDQEGNDSSASDDGDDSTLSDVFESNQDKTVLVQKPSRATEPTEGNFLELLPVLDTDYDESHSERMQTTTTESNPNESQAKLSFESFKIKMKSVYDYEFRRFNIPFQTVISTMWLNHKLQFGKYCDENCPCPLMLPVLTNNVVEKYLTSQLRADPTWVPPNELAQLDIDETPTGMSTCFASKFIPKLRSKYPEDGPLKTLDRIVFCWRKHLGQLNFGGTCSSRCLCIEGWNFVFNEGSMERKAMRPLNRRKSTTAAPLAPIRDNDQNIPVPVPASNKIPKKKQGSTASSVSPSDSAKQTKLSSGAYCIDYDPFKALGFVVRTFSGKSNTASVCRIVSVSTTESSKKAHLSASTVVEAIEILQGSEGQCKNLKFVQSHRDLKLHYYSARTGRAATFRVWFSKLDPSAELKPLDGSWDGGESKSRLTLKSLTQKVSSGQGGQQAGQPTLEVTAPAAAKCKKGLPKSTAASVRFDDNIVYIPSPKRKESFDESDSPPAKRQCLSSSTADEKEEDWLLLYLRCCQSSTNEWLSQAKVEGAFFAEGNFLGKEQVRAARNRAHREKLVEYGRQALKLPNHPVVPCEKRKEGYSTMSFLRLSAAGVTLLSIGHKPKPKAEANAITTFKQEEEEFPSAYPVRPKVPASLPLCLPICKDQRWFVSGGSTRQCDFFTNTYDNTCKKKKCSYLHLQPSLGPSVNTQGLRFQRLHNVLLLEQAASNGSGPWFTSAYLDKEKNIYYRAEGGKGGKQNTGDGVWWYPSKKDAQLAVERVVAASQLHINQIRALSARASKGQRHSGSPLPGHYRPAR